MARGYEHIHLMTLCAFSLEKVDPITAHLHLFEFDQSECVPSTANASPATPGAFEAYLS